MNFLKLNHGGVYPEVESGLIIYVGDVRGIWLLIFLMLHFFLRRKFCYPFPEQLWRFGGFFREPNFHEPKFLNRAYTPSVCINILGSDSVMYVQILSVDDEMGLTLRSGNRTSMGKQAEGTSAEGGGAQSRESTWPAGESRPARQSRPQRHQRAEISGEKRTMPPRAKVSVSICRSGVDVPHRHLT